MEVCARAATECVSMSLVPLDSARGSGDPGKMVVEALPPQTGRLTLSLLTLLKSTPHYFNMGCCLYFAHLTDHNLNHVDPYIYRNGIIYTYPTRQTFSRSCRSCLRITYFSICTSRHLRSEDFVLRKNKKIKKASRLECRDHGRDHPRQGREGRAR